MFPLNLRDTHCPGGAFRPWLTSSNPWSTCSSPCSGAANQPDVLAATSVATFGPDFHSADAGNSASEYDFDPNYRAEWYAAGLVHEAVHVRDYRNGRPYEGRDGELTSLTVQLAVLKALNAPRSMTGQIETIIKNIDDPAYQYWITPAPLTPATR